MITALPFWKPQALLQQFRQTGSHVLVSFLGMWPPTHEACFDPPGVGVGNALMRAERDEVHVLSGANWGCAVF